jgi:hypothetical protein
VISRLGIVVPRPPRPLVAVLQLCLRSRCGFRFALLLRAAASLHERWHRLLQATCMEAASLAAVLPARGACAASASLYYYEQPFLSTRDGIVCCRLPAWRRHRLQQSTCTRSLCCFHFALLLRAAASLHEEWHRLLQATCMEAASLAAVYLHAEPLLLPLRSTTRMPATIEGEAKSVSRYLWGFGRSGYISRAQRQ